jgi:hypothetical protein
LAPLSFRSRQIIGPLRDKPASDGGNQLTDATIAGRAPWF